MLDKMDDKKLMKKISKLTEELDPLARQHTDDGFGRRLNDEELANYRQKRELLSKLLDEFHRRHGWLENKFDFHCHYVDEL